jgi:FlaA1/EpsC-like NDP-sugar epimerase
MVREYLVQLPQVIFRRRPLFIHIFQAVLVSVSLVSAWLLRFDFSLPYRRTLLMSGLLLITIRLATLRLFNLNHGWWHFAGVSEALNILKAVGAGSLAFLLLIYVFRVPGFPRSIYFLEAILTASLLSGTRLVSRVLVESVRCDSSHLKRVMLVGAGFAAQMVLRELARADSGYSAVGCADDDESKVGIHVHGVPILGRVDELKALVDANPVDEILIAIPSATGKQMRRITTECQKTHLPFKTVPTLSDIIRGEATVSQFREVRLEDLLGRDPVQIDLQTVRHYLQGNVIAVTGASGSIGSELCRQILEFDPRKLVCIDQNETGIFYLEQELSKRAGQVELAFCVANVGDTDSMRYHFSNHGIEFVFHAAAYKHVPTMESNVGGAIGNNVFSLLNLLDIAEDTGCRGFVLISSDKAVNPTSIMGASKRIGELIVTSRPRNGMRCVSVRFGNVLGSSGSVVPILQEQLRQGLPLTITHPDIRRFFMTTHEAVSLVLQAFTIGSHGDILVLEMGTPVNIAEMARTLIHLSGKSEESIRMEFTGLRAGEKLEEELFYVTEKVSSTSCDKIKCTTGGEQMWPELLRKLAELRLTLNLNGHSAIRAKVREIVPEYQWEGFKDSVVSLNADFATLHNSAQRSRPARAGD